MILQTTLIVFILSIRMASSMPVLGNPSDLGVKNNTIGQLRWWTQKYALHNVVPLYGALCYHWKSSMAFWHLSGNFDSCGRLVANEPVGNDQEHTRPLQTILKEEKPMLSFSTAIMVPGTGCHPSGIHMSLTREAASRLIQALVNRQWKLALEKEALQAQRLYNDRFIKVAKEYHLATQQLQCLKQSVS